MPLILVLNYIPVPVLSSILHNVVISNILILPAFHCFCNIFLLVVGIFQITLLLEW
jgi:hypothetical protein